MQKKFGTCKQCGCNRPINSKSICPDCVYFNNHGETRIEAQIRKKKLKPIKYTSLKRKPIKRSKIRLKKKKLTGEYEVFLEIWNEREHICCNCKMDLDRFVDEETGNPSAMLFSHIKTKGSHPELRKDKKNINLECPDCHFAHEHLGEGAYNKRKNKYLEL